MVPVTDPMSTSVAVLLIGTLLTLVVGQVLLRTGRGYLDEEFQDRRGGRQTAESVSRLVVVLFHLIVLGVLALISTVDFSAGGQLQTVVAKIGVVLLVLGVGYGVAVFGLSRVRTRRHDQDLEAEISAQAQRSREHPTAPTTQAPSIHPVIDDRP